MIDKNTNESSSKKTSYEDFERAREAMRYQMAHLDGELGRSIMETIRNTPPVDYAELDRQCAEIEARIRQARADGTY